MDMLLTDISSTTLWLHQTHNTIKRTQSFNPLAFFIQSITLSALLKKNYFCFFNKEVVTFFNISSQLSTSFILKKKVKPYKNQCTFTSVWLKIFKNAPINLNHCTQGKNSTCCIPKYNKIYLLLSHNFKKPQIIK